MTPAPVLLKNEDGGAGQMLKAQGILTEEEFAAEKVKLLG